MELTLQEFLIDALENNDNQKLIQYVSISFPVDIGNELEDFSDEDLEAFLEIIDNDLLVPIVDEAYEELQLRIIEMLNTQDILAVFKTLPTDEVVDILGLLPFSKKKILLNSMRKKESEVIETLLNYEPDSAGGIMTTEYIALKSNITVINALTKIKQIAPKTEIIETLFVINTSRELVGTIDLRDILVADDDTLLETIMDTNVMSVHPETDQEHVSQLASKYSMQVIPVVNRRNALLGIITIDDIIDVLTEEYTEDILQMGGVDKDETIDNDILSSIKMRLPWLCVNFFTALIASSIVGIFDATIEKVVALAVAMPIITGMGGNAGTQTLTIVIRNIALGEIESEEHRAILLKELVLGIVHGTLIGLLAGSFLFIVYGNIYLSLIALTAMLFNMTIACILGFLVPITLKKLNIDPALSSGIFLTTATDTFGFFVFLGLATVFMQYLI
ncbi:MAG: magnesium transporter [Lachnospirales bacterium]